MIAKRTNEGFLDTDSPISSKEMDLYGFGSRVEGVVQQILSVMQPEGFVIGLTAPWGAGKTSMIKLIEKELVSERFAESDKSPRVLKFSPWLIGNHEVLIATFLPLIADRLGERIEDSSKSARVVRYANFATSTLISASKIIEKLTMFKIPALTEFLEFLQQLLSSADGESHTLSLEELRQKAVKVLLEYKIPLLVVVDDLDRMEPQEIIDILRLVKSTANLPYVTYILAYDEEIVAKAIKNRLKIDGKSYLEKIVQLPVNVPDVSPYVLANQVRKKILEQLARANHTLSLDREPEVDLWGEVIRFLILSGLLKTPRDASRICNSFVHRMLLLKEEIEPSDLLLISIFSLKCPNVYKWIKDYLWTYHRNVVFVDRTSALAEYEKDLKQATKTDKVEFDRLAVLFEGRIPGIRFHYKDSSPSVKPGVSGTEHEVVDSDNLTLTYFEDSSETERIEATVNKRLASEEYWSLYFDYYDRQKVWTEDLIREFIDKAVNEPKQAANDIIQASVTHIPSGGNLAERLVKVLTARVKDSLIDDIERCALLKILCDVADTVCENVAPYDRFLFSMEWLFYLLFDRFIAEETRTTRNSILVKLITESKAETWIMYLVSIIYEAKKQSEGAEETEVRLSQREKQAVRHATLKRLESLKNKHDRNTDQRYSKNHLRTWKMLCPDGELGSWIEKEVKSDEGFLRFLIKFEYTRLTENGIKRVLDLGSLREFIDLSSSKIRLQRLADKRNNFQQKAVRLFVAFVNSE